MGIYTPQHYKWIIALEGTERTVDPTPTSHGIVQEEYDIFRGIQGLPTQDVGAITDQEATVIYNDRYWRYHCWEFKEPFDFCFFQAIVNLGHRGGTKILQETVTGVKIDGWLGPVTKEKTLLYNPTLLTKYFLLNQKKFYESRLRADLQAIVTGLVNRVKTTAKFCNVDIEPLYIDPAKLHLG